MFLFFCSHVLWKIWFVSEFLYLSICVRTSTCFPKIPAKVKIFLSTASLQRTTTDSCFCCSVVFCSQILTGIEKVNNEAATIFKGKKCIFFVSCTRDVCFFFEGWRGSWWWGSSHNSRPELLLFGKLRDS